jgi:hypothetical protein
MKGYARGMSRALPQRAAVQKLNIPLRNLAVAVAGASGVGFGTAQIAGLPQGNILLLGVVAYVQFNSQSDADVQATYDGDFGIGTTPLTDGTITGGDVDIVASTALGAATAGVSPTLRGTNAAQAIIDNTAGDLELNLNLLIDDANISGAATFLANGSVHIAYIVLGDD